MKQVDRNQAEDTAPTAKRVETKKPYAPPVLIKWGTLAQLTRAVGHSGANDGGKGKRPRRTR